MRTLKKKVINPCTHTVSTIQTVDKTAEFVNCFSTVSALKNVLLADMTTYLDNSKSILENDLEKFIGLVQTLDSKV